jgi:hypothetical protein
LAGIVFDNTSLSKSYIRIEIRLPSTGKLLGIAIFLVFLGIAMTILTIESDLFLLSKHEVMLKYTSRWANMVSYTTPIAFLLALAKRSKLGLFLVSLSFIFCIFILEQRSAPAFALIAASVSKIGDQRSRFLLKNKRIMILLIPVAVFFFGWQQYGWAIKAREWSLLFSKVFSLEALIAGVTHSEAFLVQGILNRVIIDGFSLPFDHLLGVFATFIPFYSEFFEPPLLFMGYFQPELFPGFIGTYGGNFWAEAIAVGGFLLLLIYVGLYLTGLFLCSVIRSSNGQIMALVYTIGTVFAFYVHRNDIAFTVLLLRGYLLIFLFCVVLASSFSMIRHRTTRSF